MSQTLISDGRPSSVGASIVVGTQVGQWALGNPVQIFNTRTGDGSDNHTFWRGAYNAPIDLSSYESCRDEIWKVGYFMTYFMLQILGL